MSNENKPLHYMQISVDHMEMMKYLTDEQLGIAFRLIFAYFYGKKSEQDIISEVQGKHDIILPIFTQIKTSIDRGRGAYEERCRVNRENGKKGGAPKGNQNARKKKESTQSKAKTATERGPSEPSAESKDSEEERHENDIRIMTKVACSILNNLQAELSAYNTSLFKFFTKEQAAEFLAVFMTSHNIRLNSSFDLWYNNGAVDFLNDIQENGSVKKQLMDFKKYVKDCFLEEISFTTIDDFLEELETNKHAAKIAVEKYFEEH